MTALRPNTLLKGGEYKIVRFINAGGFGNTYEGLDVNLNKRVAIKEFFVKDFCVRDADSTRVTVTVPGKKALIEYLKRKFVDEARAIANMEHENIVDVKALFEENGTAYYVMDFIDGESVLDVLKRRGSLPESEALPIILKVASALGYMHSENRFHLDVKPGNIMLRKKDGKVVLIDFGSSKQYAELDGENTTTMAPCYTPGYAAPEQMNSKSTRYSAATDIYALGAALYKMLTGLTPPSSIDLLSKEETLSPLPREVSKNVRECVTKAMILQRVDRMQSIDEFVALLTAEPDAEEKTLMDGEAERAEAERRRKEAEDKANRERAEEARKREDAARKAAEEAKRRSEVDKKQKHSDSGTLIGLSLIISIILIALIGLGIVKRGGIENIGDLFAKDPEHEWVDLGLPSGTLWATCNVGANSPEEYGDYFAWGETSPKSTYSSSNIKYGLGPEGEKFSKYVGYNPAINYGKVDNKTELDLEDDAAYMNWGEGWRMPSDAQLTELRENCIWTCTQKNGREGYDVKSKINGNSIFLPAGGTYIDGTLIIADYNDKPTGHYWSRSLNARASTHAYSLDFAFYGKGGERFGSERRIGLLVRPIRISSQK